MRLVWATVTGAMGPDDGIQRLEVALDDGSTGRAAVYTALAGACAPGDRVLVNTTAVDLGLGTGGLHFVVARAADSGGVALDRSSGGHIMKLRYTPLQFDVRTVEEQTSEHHDIMRAAEDLGGMPVACCGLHSQAPLVAAAVKAHNDSLRVAYVMTDSAALPLALSEVVRAAREAGFIDATFSSGQAFGGQYEAVNLHSALLAARHVARADVAIVAIGPGVVGTATPFGHGGVAQGEAVNAVVALGGTPVTVLRLSFADTRPRHRCLSHHSTTALTRVALSASLVPVPRLPPEQAQLVEEALARSRVPARHRLVPSPGATPDMRGVRVTTMGRAYEDDPAFFAAAFAAGEVCARVAEGTLPAGGSA
ncbi:MAG TPA: DUF3866 family protein [Coriobacteriia bacterium]|nr:DUF3866 family protein [Coriobacteriia bacterium]